MKNLKNLCMIPKYQNLLFLSSNRKLNYELYNRNVQLSVEEEREGLCSHPKLYIVCVQAKEIWRL